MVFIRVFHKALFLGGLGGRLTGHEILGELQVKLILVISSPPCCDAASVWCRWRVGSHFKGRGRGGLGVSPQGFLCRRYQFQAKPKQRWLGATKGGFWMLELLTNGQKKVFPE